MDLEWRDWIESGYEKANGSYVAREAAGIRATCAENTLRYGFPVRPVAKIFEVKVEAVLKLRASLG